MNTLIVNALMYIITAFFLKKKFGMSPLVFLWFYYATFAIFGVLAVYYEIYYEDFPTCRNQQLSLEPYIYNYICMVLLSFPLASLKGEKLNFHSIKLHPKFNLYAKTIFLIFSVLFLCKVIELSLYGNMSYYERHTMIINDGESYSLSSISPILDSISRTCTRIYQILYPFVVFFILYFLQKNKLGIQKLIVWGVISIAPMLTGYIISGNRAGLFYLLINLTFFFFIIKQYLSKKTLYRIYFLAFIITFILFSISMDISEERFQHTEMGTIGKIQRYFGEVFPNLGYQYWEHVKNYTLGARKFITYYSLFDDANSLNLQGFDETFSYWSFITGVDTALFKTVFGDLYIEFGTVGAICFSVVLSLILFMLTRKYPPSIYNIPIYYYYYAFCTNLIFDIGTMYTSLNFIYLLIGMILVTIYLNKTHFFKYKTDKI